MLQVVLDDPRAKVPSLAHPTDVGYDLTVIDEFKRVSSKVTLFETGVRVRPPAGFYCEIVPRSSISKTGYMLANSVGTIDPDYTGTLKIALAKVDPDAPDLVPPFTKCQLVLRPIHHAAAVEVVSDLQTTQRGDGGFGSTG